MKLASWIRTPFTQPTDQGTGAPKITKQGTPLPKITDAPQMIKLPEAVGQGDEAMIFRSALLRNVGDGCELREVLDRMIMVHPGVAADIIAAGSLGRVHFDQAVAALRVYMIHKVAQAPVVVL